MDLSDLAPFVLAIFLVGMILGVGVLTIEKMGNVAKESTDIRNETVVIASGTVTLTNDDVTAFTNFGNMSSNYNGGIDTEINWTAGGVIKTNYSDGRYNVSYTYDADTDANTALTGSINALTPIASDWMPLIVTVSILSIILGLVLTAFAVKSSRR